MAPPRSKLAFQEATLDPLFSGHLTVPQKNVLPRTRGLCRDLFPAIGPADLSPAISYGFLFRFPFKNTIADTVSQSRKLSTVFLVTQTCPEICLLLLCLLPCPHRDLSPISVLAGLSGDSFWGGAPQKLSCLKSCQVLSRKLFGSPVLFNFSQRRNEKGFPPFGCDTVVDVSFSHYANGVVLSVMPFTPFNACFSHQTMT